MASFLLQVKKKKIRDSQFTIQSADSGLTIMKKRNTDNELSRPLKIDKVPMGGVEERIVARPEERAALVRRLDLVDLTRFEAFLNVDHERDGMFVVTGSIYAELVQRCVVTLEPVPQTVRDRIDVLFAPPNLIKPAKDNNLGDGGEADPPEPIENGLIDLGELAVQHLAMAIDPYPRKEGVAWEGYEAKPSEEAAPEAEARNPFAKLTLVKGD